MPNDLADWSQRITVDFAAGSSVTISGTSTVSFAPGQSVAITGTPTVSFAAGSTVSISSGTINITGPVSIQNVVATQIETSMTPVALADSGSIGNGTFTLAGSPPARAKGLGLLIKTSATFQLNSLIGNITGIDLTKSTVPLQSGDGIAVYPISGTTDTAWTANYTTANGGTHRLWLIAYMDLQAVFVRSNPTEFLPVATMAGGFTNPINYGASITANVKRIQTPVNYFLGGTVAAAWTATGATLPNIANNGGKGGLLGITVSAALVAGAQEIRVSLRDLVNGARTTIAEYVTQGGAGNSSSVGGWMTPVPILWTDMFVISINGQAIDVFGSVAGSWVGGTVFYTA